MTFKSVYLACFLGPSLVLLIATIWVMLRQPKPRIHQHRCIGCKNAICWCCADEGSPAEKIFKPQLK